MDHHPSSPTSYEVSALAGGTLHLGSAPAPEAVGPAPSLPSSRVYGGIHRSTVTEGGLSLEATGGTARHVVSYEGTPGGSVLATLDAHGRSQSVELIPGNPASRTSVEVALREGVLRRNGSGQLEEVAGQSFQQQIAVTQEQARATHQAQQAAQGEASEGVFNAQEDAAWAEALADVPEHAFDRVSASMVKAMTFGDSFEGAARSLSQETGMDMDRADELVEFGYMAQRAIVDRAIAKAGVTAELQEAFYAHVSENPGRLNEAVIHLLHARDVSRFQALAHTWMAGQPKGGGAVSYRYELTPEGLDLGPVFKLHVRSAVPFEAQGIRYCADFSHCLQGHKAGVKLFPLGARSGAVRVFR